MNAAVYTEDQLDALGELVNIAMGRAGASLGQVLDAHVRLSVPRVRMVYSPVAARAVTAMTGGARYHVIVRQAFFSALCGEAMVLFGPGGGRHIADLLGYATADEADADEEVLLDVSNILVSAVLNGLAAQIGGRFGYQAPTIMARETDLGALLEPASLPWRRALLITLAFGVESRGFDCQLVLLMPEKAAEQMRAVLDRILAEL